MEGQRSRFGTHIVERTRGPVCQRWSSVSGCLRCPTGHSIFEFEVIGAAFRHPFKTKWRSETTSSEQDSRLGWSPPPRSWSDLPIGRRPHPPHGRSPRLPTAPHRPATGPLRAPV